MENILTFRYAKRIRSILFVFAGLISSVRTFAQSVPDKVDVDIDTSDIVWYGQSWIWVLGVAVFIVIIIAITRNGNKNKV